MLSRFVTMLLFLFLCSSTLFAVDGKVKVYIKSNDVIYTSQKTTIAIELLSNALSITDVRIHFPSSDTYIVQAPKSAAYLGSKEVEGETWTMVHYEYEVYALRAGTIHIPSFPVSFTASMGYGQPKKEFELQSEALELHVKAPEGVKNNQFIFAINTS